MDAGIINAYKAHYRRFGVHFDAIDTDQKPQIEISDAICWTKLSWDQMSAETIKNCWHHNMGIIPAEVSLVESTADVSSSSSTGLRVGDTGPLQNRDFGNLFERLNQAFNIPAELLMSPDEYIAINSPLPTNKLMTDGEILAMVTNAEDSGEEDGEEEAEENDEPDGEDGKTMRTHISHIQASNAVDVLIKYFKQSNVATADDMQPLSLIKRHVYHVRFCSQKQRMISDFFHHRTAT